MSSSIFVVDSNPAVRRMIEEISAPEGFEVAGFQDGPAALTAARRSNPSLIIADYHLDNMTFSGFCKEINKLDNLADTYLVSLINSSDRPDEGHLRSLGVKAFLKKPFQAEDLLAIKRRLGLPDPRLTPDLCPLAEPEDPDSPSEGITLMPPRPCACALSGSPMCGAQAGGSGDPDVDNVVQEVTEAVMAALRAKGR